MSDRYLHTVGNFIHQKMQRNRNRNFMLGFLLSPHGKKKMLVVFIGLFIAVIIAGMIYNGKL